jgi:hypothetical protein
MLLARLLVLLAGSVAACGGEMGPNDDPSATFRVLFIGNSLTYTNDLPSMVKALADSAGVERSHFAMVAFPNFALEDHWAQGEALTAIRRGGWDHVIMQQGPSALPESRVNLIFWAKKLAEEIRMIDAVPGMYTVWPSSDRSGDFPRVVESYQMAADSIGGPAFPAGAAWLAAWEVESGLALYGGDGFHPSPRGSYLAAITIFGRLYHRSAVGLPNRLSYGLGTLTLSAAEALLMQRAADQANGR